MFRFVKPLSNVCYLYISQEIVPQIGSIWRLMPSFKAAGHPHPKPFRATDRGLGTPAWKHYFLTLATSRCVNQLLASKKSKQLHLKSPSQSSRHLCSKRKESIQATNADVTQLWNAERVLSLTLSGSLPSSYAVCHKRALGCRPPQNPSAPLDFWVLCFR